MSFFQTPHVDSYFVDDTDDDSSVKSESSSEDEIDAILQGTFDREKKIKLLQNKHGRLLKLKDENDRKSSSSEDEFEKEVNAELNQHMTYLQHKRDGTQEESSNGKSQGSKQAEGSQEKFYNDVYFDSDEEEEIERKHHAILSNDDLLYDPQMDEKDQMWMDCQRQKHLCGSHKRVRSGQGAIPAKKPSSDALLDCPACLTTLCMDCQRHETYKNQYRAMFVMNCIVDTSERLQCPEQAPKSQKKKKGQLSSSSEPSSSNSDWFHPVRCSECNTVVGVYDDDEVFHFFNVIASHT